eukprot:4533505-Amphidinium_carterae.1
MTRRGRYVMLSRLHTSRRQSRICSTSSKCEVGSEKLMSGDQSQSWTPMRRHSRSLRFRLWMLAAYPLCEQSWKGALRMSCCKV